jgi:hypothetical protein
MRPNTNYPHFAEAGKPHIFRFLRRINSIAERCSHLRGAAGGGSAGTKSAFWH